MGIGRDTLSTFLKLLISHIAWIASCFQTNSVSDAESRFNYLTEGVNGFAAAADILLSVTMVRLLYQARTGIHQSDNMLTKLMVRTLIA